MARQIHELSDRRHEPFLTVNCEVLTCSTIEEELFGQVRDPFAGMGRERAGKFAQAGRGTLFLDGVDALPLPVQAKLLRVVEDRVFEPVGADQPVPLMARLIAASNRPLLEEIAEHRFRSDLFYRLNVVGLQIPPLRERRDAIAPLAQRFLGEFAAAYGREFDPIDEETLQALQEHDWPGNVRELRNVLDRCAATCATRTIRRQDLPNRLGPWGAPPMDQSDQSSRRNSSACRRWPGPRGEPSTTGSPRPSSGTATTAFAPRGNSGSAG